MKGSSINGYFIMFDVKDSAYRKKKYKDLWFGETSELFQMFREFIVQMKNELNSLEVINCKLLGDGLMVFFKDLEEHPKEKVAVKLLGKSYDFKKEVHFKFPDRRPILLRTVIAYLTGISLLEDIKSNSKDLALENSFSREILGSQLDFAFRLERFSDSSHITINKTYLDLIFRDLPKFSLNYIECFKRIKGWESVGETFYILTNPEMIKESIMDTMSSVYSLDVFPELFKYYLNCGSSQTPNFIDSTEKNMIEENKSIPQIKVHSFS